MARSRIEIAGDAPQHQADGTLALRAAEGDREALEELYRRHARTAMRVAYRVTGNIHDAGDAVSDAFARVMQALPKGQLATPGHFRSYLLTTTRHAAVDVLRRGGRTVPTADDPEPAQTIPGPAEVFIDATDSALVSAAFRALPERWRSVLWLTEVEQIPAREAAGMLGVSPNGVAQLAVRARNGLRERYLQAHLREVDGECRQAVERLGGYVAGALAARDLAVVDQHLTACEACTAREAELRQIGTTLRRGFVPAVGGLLWRLIDRVHRLAAQWTSPGSAAAAAKVVPVGVAAAGVFVASLAGAGIVSHRAPDQHGVAAIALPAASAPAPTVTSTPAASSASSSGPAASAVRIAPANSSIRNSSTSARTVRAQQRAAAVGNASATTTTTTTATTAPSQDQTPADHADNGGLLPITVPVTLPDLPVTTTSLTLPTVDVPTTIPDPATVSALLEAPLDAAYQLQDALGTVLSADDPLPSPSAPGLPV